MAQNKKIKNDLQIVYDQLLYLYNNYDKYDNINLVNYPYYNDKKKLIGENIKLHFEQYEEEFLQFNSSNKFYLLFNDGGLINLHYIFNTNGEIIEHHLSYFPNPNIDGEKRDYTLSKHVRIDFDELGYRPCIHSYVHMHCGQFSNYRLPFNQIIFPLEFVSFINIHIYKKCKIVESKNIGKKLTIQDCEYGSFFLGFEDTNKDNKI